MNLLWLQLLVSLWALIYFSELARLDVKIPKPSSSMSLHRLSRHPVFYDHTTTQHRGWPNVLPLQLCHAFLCIVFGLGLLHLPTRCPTVSSFLLVDISTSFGEVFYANVSLLRNRKFNVISQSGWIILHANISCKIDFLFAR